MTRFSIITKAILRFLVVWGVDAFSLLITAAIFAGISFVEPDYAAILKDAFAAAFLLRTRNKISVASSFHSPSGAASRERRAAARSRRVRSGFYKAASPSTSSGRGFDYARRRVWIMQGRGSRAPCSAHAKRANFRSRVEMLHLFRDDSLAQAGT